MADLTSVDKDLIPPDFERCQCERKMGSFMTLGPRRYERCTEKPAYIAVEIAPAPDGKRGAMSLCLGCAKAMLDNRELRRRVQLQPIIHEEKTDGNIR